MKGGYLYTIVFMLILTIVLTSALALANSGFAPQIERNVQVAEKRAVLDAFGLDASGLDSAIESTFAGKIRLATNSRGQQLYVMLDDSGATAGIAAPIDGAGLWGKIRGYIALKPDLSALLGIVFTDQNETPGLGGRIAEAQYRNQFRGLALKTGQPLAYNGPGYENLDAIAGATLTSKSVLKIINDFVAGTLPGLSDGLEVTP